MPQCPYNLTSTYNSLFLCKWMLTHSYQALWKNTNMALQTGHKTEEGESYFIKVGISANSAKSSAVKFAMEKLRKENLWMMDLAMLKELGIMAMEEALSLNKLRSLIPRPSMLRHHWSSFPNSTSKRPSNNSENFESIGNCSPEWQTCQLLRPVSSYTVALMNLSKT